MECKEEKKAKNVITALDSSASPRQVVPFALFTCFVKRKIFPNKISLMFWLRVRIILDRYKSLKDSIFFECRCPIIKKEHFFILF